MNSVAARKIRLSDTRYSFTTKAEEIRLDDVEGHVIQLREAKGVDVGTRLLAVSASTFDLVKGNGTRAGYTTLMGPDGAALAHLKQEGKVTTTLSAEGTPAVTAEGTWSLVKGVGEWEGSTGGGTWRLRMIAEGISIMDWEGERVQP